MNQQTVFNRYRPLVEDWPAFQAASIRPLPTCLWTNTLRLSPGRLAQILAADGLDFEPAPGYPGAFELKPEVKPGRHWAYLAGLYQVQETVALLPVHFLDPQPGERVLDLCAAPGNKTAQIAVAMANSGTVVANDINFDRMRAVRQTIERLGLLNVTTTTANGANLPAEAGYFDRVLVDAPCSCEGTSRKEPVVMERCGPALSARKSGLQKALLRKAVQHCRPGGRIVYATCTYAPEENEMVVAAILEEFGPAALRLIPTRLAGFVSAPGLTAWNGQQFPADMAGAMRVWPHQNDTGGFFIATLEKRETAAEAALPAPGEPVEKIYPPASPLALETVENRFGLPPSDFAPYHLFQANRKRTHLVCTPHRPPTRPAPDTAGLSFVKTEMRYPKLSTAAAMIFGPQARRNVIPVDSAQTHAYLRRRDFQVTAEQAEACTGVGYALIEHKGFVLGVGLYRPDPAGGGQVHSMYPKGWAPI